jgi:hypothetical protein
MADLFLDITENGESIPSHGYESEPLYGVCVGIMFSDQFFSPLLTDAFAAAAAAAAARASCTAGASGTVDLFRLLVGKVAFGLFGADGVLAISLPDAAEHEFSEEMVPDEPDSADADTCAIYDCEADF